MSFLTAVSLLLLSVSYAETQTTTNPQPQIDIRELSSSDQHGCKAYLCFAGGMAVSECQSTIRKVKRDLIRGRAFPTCSAISNPDGSVGGQNGSPRIWSEKTRKRVYIKMQEPDGTVKQLSSFRRR